MTDEIVIAKSSVPLVFREKTEGHIKTRIHFPGGNMKC